MPDDPKPIQPQSTNLVTDMENVERETGVRVRSEAPDTIRSPRCPSGSAPPQTAPEAPVARPAGQGGPNAPSPPAEPPSSAPVSKPEDQGGITNWGTPSDMQNPTPPAQ